MVFGGRRSMATPISKSLPVSGTMANDWKPDNNLMDHEVTDCKHYKIFEDDPEFHMWLEQPDPIIIECEDGIGSHPHIDDEFRLHSQSLSEEGPGKVLKNKMIPKLAERRTWSEGNLALNGHSDQKIPSSNSCPCEAIQGVYSHGTCAAMDTTSETCCSTCGSDWASDHTSWACFECGGYGLFRPCGLCNGKCGEKWKRDLKTTHSTGEASWSGKCKLEKENHSLQERIKREPGIQ